MRRRKPRDSQRSKAYEAERTMPDFWKVTHPSLEDVQRELDRILRQDWFVEKFGRLNYRLKKGRTNGRGGVEARTLSMVFSMPYEMRTRWVILHELAHGIQHTFYPFGTVQGHGPEWAGIYLYLVKRVLGASEHQALSRAFILGRVSFLRRIHLPKEETPYILAARKRNTSGRI